jgi:hypothetical protein
LIIIDFIDLSAPGRKNPAETFQMVCSLLTLLKVYLKVLSIPKFRERRFVDEADAGW